MSNRKRFNPFTRAEGSRNPVSKQRTKMQKHMLMSQIVVTKCDCDLKVSSHWGGNHINFSEGSGVDAEKIKILVVD